jgi:hypothetical protein
MSKNISWIWSAIAAVVDREDMGRECRKEAGLVGKVLLKRYLYRPGESFRGRYLEVGGGR